jgi:hypothetical protein
MGENKAHKATVNRVIQRYGGEYNSAKGADIKSHLGTIEVETEKTVSQAPTQLQGYRGPVYIAGTNKEAVQKALETTKNTTIGVMDNKGNVVKHSIRR